jgi:hypothetical protein
MHVELVVGHHHLTGPMLNSVSGLPRLQYFPGEFEDLPASR